MKKSSTKLTKNTTSKSKTKEPVLSTGKKIGLTVYFTFVFTLMGIMGLQIWMNSMNTSINNDSITTPEVVQNDNTNPATIPYSTPQTPNNSPTQPQNTQTPDLSGNSTQNSQTPTTINTETSNNNQVVNDDIKDNFGTTTLDYR